MPNTLKTHLSFIRKVTVNEMILLFVVDPRRFARKAHFVRHVTLKAAALLFVGDPGIEPGTSTLSV
ncbi:MAG: hypothetical protein UW10_C0036G0004 [Candidatus Magasanikbacteria bacterium GW2011_GWA2_43_9]|nr:MAG: hypothetical protein UW10_C0036G0004 [Candidatus Magasanikbacteria bacterium GW2011_GWA2_43_9]